MTLESLTLLLRRRRITAVAAGRGRESRLRSSEQAAAPESLEHEPSLRELALERANAALRDELSHWYRAQQDVSSNETHFRALVETSGDIVWSADATGCCTYVNGSAFEATLGYRAEEIIGFPFTHFATAASAQTFDDEFFKLMETGAPLHVDGAFLHRDGSTVYLTINAIALRDGEGNFIGTSGTAVDVSKLKTAEALLRHALAEQQSIFDSATVGIAIVDNGSIVRANAELERMFGFPDGGANGAVMAKLLVVDDSEGWLRTAARAIVTRGVYDCDVVCARPSGARFWSRVTVRAYKQDGGDSTIWVLHDISDRKQKEREIEHAALHDALTGLPNRALLSDRLAHHIEHAARANVKFGVLFVDLDRFKVVNDTIGHDGGDHLLRTVADRLRQRVRGRDTVARQGGDEFIVMLPEIGTIADIEHVAETLLREIAQPIQIFGSTYVVTGSIGISVYPDHGTDATALLKHADAAMYRAKEIGKNTFMVFNRDLHIQASEDVRVENRLRIELDKGGLDVHYQPRVELATGRICSLEALARWHDDTLGFVEPSRFIPLAERAGLIGRLGDAVLRRACEDLAHLSALGYSELGLSVNVSHCQLTDPGLVAKVRCTLDQFGLDPRRLELELTETAIAHNVDQAVQIMRNFAAQGIRIAIDDFGTGYSSLSQLKHFPIRTLKIDRSFVDGLPHDEDDAAIVLAIIAMARRLKIRVVGEGIETPEQLRFLAQHEGQEGQGHLFGAAMPLDEVVNVLSEELARTSTGSGRGAGARVIALPAR